MSHWTDVQETLAIACARAGWTSAEIVAALEIPADDLDRQRRQNLALDAAFKRRAPARPRGRRRKASVPVPVSLSNSVPGLARRLGVSPEATVRLLKAVDQQP